MVAFGDWEEWDQFSNTGGAAGNVLMHPPKVVQGVMDSLVKRNASACPLCQGILHGAEDVLGSWECDCH